MSNVAAESYPEHAPSPISSRNSLAVSLLVLVAILLLGIPQFLRLPLTNDPVYYDLQADNVRDGGVLYRDMMEPNLPGVVWLHLLVRPVLGKSSEALRFVDFVILASSIAALALAIRRQGASTVTCWWFACAALWCYFSLAEWSHCQRDAWLLLPSGVALAYREKQVARLRGGAVPRVVFFYGLVEGVVWAVGFWIKPHIMIPGVLVWLTSTLLARRWRRSLADGAGMLVGGLLIGTLGSLWLIRTGAWPYFWEMLLVWNPIYVAGVRRGWSLTFFQQMVVRFLPWVLLHFVTIAVSLAWWWRSIRVVGNVTAPFESKTSTTGITADERRSLWAILYLGWMLQASFLQILFDYVHVPGLLLSIGITAMWYTKQPTASMRWTFAVLAILALLISPLARPYRLQQWSRCIRGPNSPELRNHLRQIEEPNWQELEQVAQFLEKQNVQSGDVVCYNNHLIHLFPRLGIRPTIRFVYQATYQQLAKSRLTDIQRDLLDHPPRYIISDLQGLGMSPLAARESNPQEPLALPSHFPANARKSYPWRYPVVFRAGSVLVHEFPRGPQKPMPAVED